MRTKVGLVALLVATLPLAAQEAPESQAPADEALAPQPEEFTDESLFVEEEAAEDESSASVALGQQPVTQEVELQADTLVVAETQAELEISEDEEPVQLEPDGTLNFYAGNSVRRTLALEVTRRDADGELAEKMTMAARAVLRPMNPEATQLELNIEAIALRAELFGDDALLVAIDTEATAFGDPTIWWRSRRLRADISTPLNLTLDEEGIAHLDHEASELVQATVEHLVPRCERLFWHQWLDGESTGFLAATEGTILGDGLLFRIIELGDASVVAAFEETGAFEGTGRTEGTLTWDPIDAFLFELQQTADYYLEVEEPLDEASEGQTQVVEANVVLSVTSELAA